jgi:hypothetical protein
MIKSYEAAVPVPIQKKDSLIVNRSSDADPEHDAGLVIEAYPERANLYELTLEPVPAHLYQLQRPDNGKMREEVRFDALDGTTTVPPTIRNVRRALQTAVLEALQEHGYRVRARFALVVNTLENYAPISVRKSLQIYPAFKVDVQYTGSRYYLRVDHQLVVRASISLAALLKLDPDLHLDDAQRAMFRTAGDWGEGRLLGVNADQCRLAPDAGSEIAIVPRDVFPRLTRTQVAQLAPKLGIRADELERSIKQLSFLTIANAPRARLDACTEFARQISDSAFPIRRGEITVKLAPTPAVLRPPAFALGRDLVEPAVAFDHVDRSKRAADILTGLERFGAYDKPSSQLRIALFTTSNRTVHMQNLVERLNRGAHRYSGAQKTFGGSIAVQELVVCATVDDYEDRIREFVRGSARDKTDVALVYLPESDNPRDPRHPYFRVKGLLAREGVASQMVDEPTVLNPDWRDLNLALNLFAKAGHVPWVLDEAIDGVDLFIGLSSSQIRRDGRIERMMGYVNVFDSYGRWRFYQGDSLAFAFDDRLKHYADLVKNSVAAYRAENVGPLKSVQVHLTKCFSAEERRILAAAVRSVAPDAVVVFVWINPYHNLRLYNLADGSDGQVQRSTYLRDDPGRLYLATTGANQFNQKGMGTPIPLQLTVWSDPVDARPSLSRVGQQVLALTRLNWASSRNFCQEPITTKFAGDIARLMSAFMIDPNFSINPSLRGQPWFL